MSFKDLAKTESTLKDGLGKAKDAPPAEQPVKDAASATERPPSRKP